MKFKNKKTGEILEFSPIMINAALVSAQNRKRLFWVGKLVGDTYEKVEIPQPQDRGILLKDILENNINKKYIKGVASRTYPRYKNGKKRNKQIEIRDDEKSNAMTSVSGDSMILENSMVRKFTPIECERLQSLPDNFTEGVSNTQRYKALGNAFNCEVVKHILKFIK